VAAVLVVAAVIFTRERRQPGGKGEDGETLPEGSTLERAVPVLSRRRPGGLAAARFGPVLRP
jgi:hypothetical protein